MIQIKIKSIYKEPFYLYKLFIFNMFKKLNLPYKAITLPIKKKVLTILKSPHVYKSSREQFIIKKYTLLIKLQNYISLNTLKSCIINKPKTIKICLINTKKD